MAHRDYRLVRRRAHRGWGRLGGRRCGNRCRGVKIHRHYDHHRGRTAAVCHHPVGAEWVCHLDRGADRVAVGWACALVARFQLRPWPGPVLPRQELRPVRLLLQPEPGPQLQAESPPGLLRQALEPLLLRAQVLVLVPAPLGLEPERVLRLPQGRASERGQLPEQVRVQALQQQAPQRPEWPAVAAEWPLTIPALRRPRRRSEAVAGLPALTLPVRDPQARRHRLTPRGRPGFRPRSFSWLPASLSLAAASWLRQPRTQPRRPCPLPLLLEQAPERAPRALPCDADDRPGPRRCSKNDSLPRCQGHRRGQ